MSRSSRRSTAHTEEAIIVALFDVANHLARRGERLARRADLTTQQWMVLLEIGGDPSFARARRQDGRSEEQGVLPSEIAFGRGVARATVSTVVAQLERQGLIRQIADPVDGRRRRLRITSAGERALARVEPERRRANRRLLGALAPRERTAFLRCLQHCLSRLVEP